MHDVVLRQLSESDCTTLSGLQLEHLVKTAMHVEQNFNMQYCCQGTDISKVDNTTSIQNTRVLQVIPSIRPSSLTTIHCPWCVTEKLFCRQSATFSCLSPRRLLSIILPQHGRDSHVSLEYSWFRACYYADACRRVSFHLTTRL
jgi:hypothetical protein